MYPMYHSISLSANLNRAVPRRLSSVRGCVAAVAELITQRHVNVLRRLREWVQASSTALLANHLFQSEDRGRAKILFETVAGC